jgi:hypothetical protein
MKLTKAQQEVLDKAKANIDFARTHDFYDWFRDNWSFDTEKSNWSDDQINNYYEDMERFNKTDVSFKDEDMDEFIDLTKGIYRSIRVNSKTLVKLEKMGLIEILYDSNGDRFGIDRIKILNY